MATEVGCSPVPTAASGFEASGYRTTFARMVVDQMQRTAERRDRAIAALKAARIPHAVVGGNAVFLYISAVHAGSAMTTNDVDLLVRRSDLPAIVSAMGEAGFDHKHKAGIDFFVEPGSIFRDGVRLLLAGEKVNKDYVAANPDVEESVRWEDGNSVIALPALVRMKLTSHRLKDQVHLREMIYLGLIGPELLPGLPPPLAERFQLMLDTPEDRLEDGPDEDPQG